MRILLHMTTFPRWWSSRQWGDRLMDVQRPSDGLPDICTQSIRLHSAHPQASATVPPSSDGKGKDEHPHTSSWRARERILETSSGIWKSSDPSRSEIFRNQLAAHSTFIICSLYILRVLYKLKAQSPDLFISYILTLLAAICLPLSHPPSRFPCSLSLPTNLHSSP